MIKLDNELTTADSLVNDSESEDEAVFFVTPITTFDVIHNGLAREFVKNKSAKVLKLILCKFL